MMQSIKLFLQFTRVCVCVCNACVRAPAISALCDGLDDAVATGGYFVIFVVVATADIFRLLYAYLRCTVVRYVRGVASNIW